ncbi:nucleoside hydrolase-like domain-containing protein [Candidatus Latescibacterota bacterium]
MNGNVIRLCGALLLIIILMSLPISAQQQEFLAVEKQRVIVLTDITNEPDDQESLVRFLVYANEYDVEGLIATTSIWLQNKVCPEKIIELIGAYGKVQNNLLKHAPGFPSEEQLFSVVREHLPVYGMSGVGEGKSSSGSRHIIEVVDNDDPRPVWISVWGGANCLAQVLYDVRSSRTEAELKKFVSKLRVYTISDQDDSGRWMRIEFPDLFYIVTPCEQRSFEYYHATWTGISGDRQYKNGPMHKFELVDNPWLEEHVIRNHGPLGALYPRLEYIMEGDTPSFIGLINNGLGSPLSPAYGGWGGRYTLVKTYAELRPIWTNNGKARDTVEADNGFVDTSAQATIWRWREDYQHDFAARMDWCVVDRYEDANHNPIVTLNGNETNDVLKFTVNPGSRITLDTQGTHDPDGDALSYHWWYYKEAGNYKGNIDIFNAAGTKIDIEVPSDSKDKTIHIIITIRDNGIPSLYTYRRIIIESK